MLLLAGLAVDDHRSTREKRDETLRRHADAGGSTQYACRREITANTRRARHPAAERGSVQALKRVTKSPKLHFLDAGLLAALRGITPDRLRRDRTPFGAVLETFVLGELLKPDFNSCPLI